MYTCRKPPRSANLSSESGGSNHCGDDSDNGIHSRIPEDFPVSGNNKFMIAETPTTSAGSFMSATPWQGCHAKLGRAARVDRTSQLETTVTNGSCLQDMRLLSSPRQHRRQHEKLSTAQTSRDLANLSGGAGRAHSIDVNMEREMLESAGTSRREGGVTDSPVYVELERNNVVLVLQRMEKMHTELLPIVYGIEECLSIVRALRNRAKHYNQELFIRGECSAEMRSDLEAAIAAAVAKQQQLTSIMVPNAISMVGDGEAARKTEARDAHHSGEAEERSHWFVRVPATDNLSTATEHQRVLSLTPQTSPIERSLDSPSEALEDMPPLPPVIGSEDKPTAASDTVGHDGNENGSSAPDHEHVVEEDLSSSYDQCDDISDTPSGSPTSSALQGMRGFHGPLKPVELQQLAVASRNLVLLYKERGERLRRIDKEFREHATIHERWESNEDHTTCFSCRRSFTSIRRRHHCRRCGRLTCSDCSTYCGKKQDTSLGGSHPLIKTEYAARITSRDAEEPERRCDTYTYPVSADSPDLRPLTCRTAADSNSYAIIEESAARSHDCSRTVGGGFVLLSEEHSLESNDSELNDPATVYEEERAARSYHDGMSSPYTVQPARQPKQFDWVRLCRSCYMQCLRARKTGVVTRLRNANRCILDDGFFYFHVPLPQEWRSLGTMMKKPDLFCKQVELNSAWLLEQPAELAAVPATGARLTATVAMKAPQVIKTIGSIGAYAMRSTRNVAQGLLSSFLANTTLQPPITASPVGLEASTVGEKANNEEFREASGDAEMSEAAAAAEGDPNKTDSEVSGGESVAGDSSPE